MKSFSLLFLFCLCFLPPGLAQESFMKWGQVSTEDLAMKVYPADTSASAVVLGSFCYIYFNYYDGRFQVSYKIHQRIKILRKEGYEWANVQVPLYSSDGAQAKETISDVKGITYNLDPKSGRIMTSTLEEKSIFKENIRQQRGRALQLVKFALPNINEGSILEYSYTLDSDFFTVLNAWEFQSSIPVRKSEMQIKMMGELSYVYVIQSAHPFTDSPDPSKKTAEANAGAGTYRWVQENIPAFKDEGFITTADDYIGKMQFQLASYQYPGDNVRELFSTWEKTIYELWGDNRYGSFIKRKGATKDLVSGLVAGKESEKDKLAAIYAYVKDNIRADNRSGIWTDSSPKEVLAKKKGYRHEVNLLLINMLREAGLEANPILLSTREHGKPYKNYPILERFNHSIAHVKLGEEEFLLDATHPMQPLGMLPANVLNGEGLLMDKDGKESRWINLQNRYKSSETVMATLRVSPEGGIDGKMEVSTKGYEALRLRAKHTKLDEEDSVAEKPTSLGQQYGLVNDSISNLEEYDQPLGIKGRYQNQEFAQANGERIYLDPLLAFKTKANPFKAVERKHVVDFAYPFDEFYFINYTIPEGYVVEEVPKPERFQWADKALRFEYSATPKDNTVQVVCRLFVNRAVFAPEEYKTLRDSFAKIVAKQNEQIVLKKK
jgi:Transglutaminase-like superfamily/Domain of Unknown Function with PDB structure (DUF3857)